MIVAGTGHRPDKMPDGYHPRTLDLMKRTARSFLNTLPGVEGIITGGALGWDTALALVAIEEGIPLTLAMPFVGQERKWREADQKVYRWITRRASRVEVICKGGYSPAKMQTRNQWMVDHCDRLLALWDGTDGGTANCLLYAEGEHRLVTNLYDRFLGIRAGEPWMFGLHPESESGIVACGEAEFEVMWSGSGGCLEYVTFQEYAEAREAGWAIEWLPEWDFI